MLNYYTDKKYVPDGTRIINKNITYFGTGKLEDNSETRRILKSVDGADYSSDISFTSKFNGVNCSLILLSTGCKTALNVLYNKDVCFDLAQCGSSAVDAILLIKEGSVLLERIPITYGNGECSVLINGEYLCKVLTR